MMPAQTAWRRRFAPLLATCSRRFQSTERSKFQFDAPTNSLSGKNQPFRVVFGAKTAQTHVGSLAQQSGIHKMLVVRDRDVGAAQRAQYAQFLLMQAGIASFEYTLKRDCATLKSVDEGVEAARRVGANGVLAFGGGSTMDMTRAIAFIMNNGGEAADYIGENQARRSDFQPAAPHLLVPTNAGSGAEVSTEALVLDEPEETKFSLTSEPILAQAVIIDPMLSLSVPLHLTVQGALAALGQCVESYLAGCGDERSDQIALDGIKTIASAFAQPLLEGKIQLKSVELRQQLALGSLHSSLAANSSGFGTAHSLAVSVGGISELPHVQVASTFLPFVLDRYTALCEENEGDEFFDAMRVKLTTVLEILTSASGFHGPTTATWVRYVANRFALPTMTDIALEDTLLKDIVTRAMQRLEESQKPNAEEDEDEDEDDDDQELIFDKTDLEQIVEDAVLNDKT